MELNIGNKDYTLEFGLEFIATLDQVYKQKSEGMEFGLGIETAVPYIKMENPTVLVSLIKAGTAHLTSKPSNTAIKEFLVDLATDSDESALENLFTEFEEHMKVAPFLKVKLGKMYGDMEKAQAQVDGEVEGA